MLRHVVDFDYTAHAQVGNSGLLENEQRSHFALWCLLKSPLFIGADLRKLSKSAAEILTASEVIAVNQDPLGVAGDLIWKEGPIEVICSCIYFYLCISASWLLALATLNLSLACCMCEMSWVGAGGSFAFHSTTVWLLVCSCRTEFSFSTLNVKPQQQQQ